MKPLLIMLALVLLAIQVKAQTVKVSLKEQCTAVWDTRKGDWVWSNWIPCSYSLWFNNDMAYINDQYVSYYTLIGSAYTKQQDSGKTRIVTQAKDKVGKQCVFKIVVSTKEQVFYFVYDDVCLVYRADF